MFSFPSSVVIQQFITKVLDQDILHAQTPLTLLQLIRLQPQSLGSELSEGGLDSLLGFRVLLNSALCTQSSSQESSLSSHEQATQAEQCVCGNVSEGRGLEHGCKVGQGLSAATGELNSDGLLGCAEGVEHGGSVLAEAEGEEETEREAYDGADGCVH